MKKIVTVSREFGSGGREIGKRLADTLGFKYVDSEIIQAIAEQTKLDENYLRDKLEQGIANYPVTIGRTFSQVKSVSNSAMLIAKQHKIIRDIAAKSDCVIVGRGADVALADLKPFKIFVYAALPSKISRIRSRAQSGEILTDKEIEREIKRIDGARKSTHDLYSPRAWGDKAGYNICINTTDTDVKSIIEPLSEIITAYFDKNS